MASRLHKMCWLFLLLIKGWAKDFISLQSLHMSKTSDGSEIEAFSEPGRYRLWKMNMGTKKERHTIYEMKSNSKVNANSRIATNSLHLLRIIRVECEWGFRPKFCVSLWSFQEFCLEKRAEHLFQARRLNICWIQLQISAISQTCMNSKEKTCKPPILFPVPNQCNQFPWHCWRESKQSSELLCTKNILYEFIINWEKIKRKPNQPQTCISFGKHKPLAHRVPLRGATKVYGHCEPIISRLYKKVQTMIGRQALL